MSYAVRADGPETWRCFERGVHPAWIVATVLGFVAWWPVGLALLAGMLWRKKMGCWNHENGRSRWERKMRRFDERFGTRRGGPGHAPSSGNRAFDEYRAETLRRLEDEQREFRDFLERLRFAKDRAEFEQFMDDRRARPPEAPPAQSPPQG